MKDQERLDFAKSKITDRMDSNGFATFEAQFTKPAVLSYKFNGKRIRELRHPDEVYKPESLKTLEMKPFTLNHKGGNLTAINAKKHSHGATGENIRRDSGSEWVVGKIAVFDIDALAVMDGVYREDGEVHLSLGYTCDTDDTPGVWNGQQYDRKQINIKYNHATGLKGEPPRNAGAKLRLDSSASEGSFLISGLEEEETKMPEIIEKKVLEPVEAGKLRFDSIKIDDTQENNALLAQRNDAIKRINDLEGELSTSQGRLDSAEKELEAEKESSKDLIPAERFDSIIEKRGVVTRLLKAAGKELPKADTYEESTRLGEILLLDPDKKESRYDSDTDFREGAFAFYSKDVEKKEKDLLAKRNLSENKRTDSSQATNKDASEEV